MQVNKRLKRNSGRKKTILNERKNTVIGGLFERVKGDETQREPGGERRKK